MSSSPLTWSLVLATYGRGPVLLRALKTAVSQTLPPKEVIIVDGSPDWRAWIGKTMALCRDNGIACQHIQAHRLSIASQRNQGIARSSGDIVMLFDDDTLFYGDCAEQILAVMERDSLRRIVGGRTALIAQPPDASSKPATTSSIANASCRFRFERAREWLRDWCGDELAFPPYDATRRISESDIAYLESVGALPAKAVAGCCMFFRRELFEREQFEELLTRYCYCEDRDFGYRAARHGLVALILTARACHLQVSAGRIDPFAAAATHVLNSAVLHRLNSSDVDGSFGILRKYTPRRSLLQALKDVRARDFAFSRFRGTWYGAKHLEVIRRKSRDDIRKWYPGIQDRLLRYAVRGNQGGDGSLVGRITRAPRKVRNLMRLIGPLAALKFACGRTLGMPCVISVKPGNSRVPLKLRTRGPDIFVLRAVFAQNECEVSLPHSPKCILDAGAFCGYTTAYFAAKWPDALVIAVEPEPSNLSMLRANCAGLDNVRIVHAALWDAEEPLEISNPDSASWGFRVERASGHSTVMGVSVESLLRQHQVDRVDLMKVDIEGAEIRVFGKNSEKWLPRVGCIIAELHGAESEHIVYEALAGRGTIESIQGEKIIVRLNEPVEEGRD